MARVKVRLHGKQGMRTTEVTPQGFPTRHIRTGNSDPTPKFTITPELKTPTEQQSEQVTAIMPAYKEAYTENRDRLIAYLTQGFFGNLSDGIVLSELGTAIKSEYAPRNAMSPAQYTSLIADLTTEDYDTVAWIQALRQYIWRTNERRRPPRPLIEPRGKYKVYLIDGESPGVDLLISAYDPEHLPRQEVLIYKYQRYCNRYNCAVRIETEPPLYIHSQRGSARR